MYYVEAILLTMILDPEKATPILLEAAIVVRWKPQQDPIKNM